MTRTVKRHKHLPKPASVKLEQEHNGRAWTLHPNKGFRSRSTVEVVSRKSKDALSTMYNWFNSLNYRSYSLGKYKTR